MLCDICGEADATVFVTQFVNGKLRKLRLCAECAKSAGLDGQEPMTEILLGAGLQKPGAGGRPAADKICPCCGMRYSDFKKSSRLGCPACYEAFQKDLGMLLEAMHRNVRHVGKAPAHNAVPAAEPAIEPDRRAELRKALEAAVRLEKYEEAASLRDQLQAMDAAVKHSAGNEPRN